MIAGIILAAGESRRMGFPKALLLYRGKTFLEGVLEAGVAAGLEPSVVVLGPDAFKILNAVDLGTAIVARNERPETGQMGSIKHGISAIINRPVDAAVVWPVDQPHVLVGTVELLILEFRARHAAIAVPTYHGRRGHPVLFGKAVFQELLDAPQDVGARAVTQAEAARVAEVPVEDPAVLEDIDTPDAYEDLVRRSGPPGNP
ncbi:MAG: nucleotidyltransferase family protein [Gemmatimonadetes bacterium]|nr:nucleotidyltransferase family protein [Gemmatimonadota bacterium]